MQHSKPYISKKDYKLAIEALATHRAHILAMRKSHAIDAYIADITIRAIDRLDVKLEKHTA